MNNRFESFVILFVLDKEVLEYAFSIMRYRIICSINLSTKIIREFQFHVSRGVSKTGNLDVSCSDVKLARNAGTRGNLAQGHVLISLRRNFSEFSLKILK